MSLKARLRDTEIFFDVDGVALFPEEDRMVERPTIFVIHGGPGGDHSGYKALLSPLASVAQLLYLDLRGQGRSARGNRDNYTLDNNVQDLEALRCHLGLEKIGLLGNSYGGMVALSYAIRYPHNVSLLIPVVATASFEFIEKAKERISACGTQKQQEVVEKLFAGAFKDEDEVKEYYDVMGPLYSMTYDGERAKRGSQRGIRSVEALNYAFSTFLREYDIRAGLSDIICPTLVIAGRHDWICPPEFSEEIANSIPQAQLSIFEKSGHAVMNDETERFLQVVREFIAKSSFENAGNAD